MAKIKTYKVEIQGKIVDLPVNCSVDGVFSTNYQGYTGPVTFPIVNKFKSLPDLMAEIDKVVKEANALATIIEDLIFYEIATGADFFTRGEDHGNAGVTLKYVAIRREVRGSQVRNFLIKRQASWDRNDRKIEWLPTVNTYQTWGVTQIKLDSAHSVPFTEANILFFETMAEKIKALKDRMTDFLQPASILALVSSNQLPEFTT